MKRIIKKYLPWELAARLSPAAQSLGPSPEASGWSPQLNSLCFRIQISLGGNTQDFSRSCKRQEGLLGGQLVEVGGLQ